MAEINLESMSMEELRELRIEVDKALSSFKDRKRREALAAAEQIVREHGFSSLSELTRARRSSKKRQREPAAPVEPRYANPDDSSQTWTGRGRRPRWVNEQMEAGRSLEEMAI